MFFGINVTKQLLMVHISKETELVKGLRDGNPAIIKRIYKDNFGKIKAMVVNFNNMDLDAEDVFQDGLTIALLNIKKGKFKGESLLSTYIYSICRNICLKEYRKNRHVFSRDTIEVAEEMEDMDHYQEIKTMLQIKTKLKEDCRKIIDLRFGIGIENPAKDETRFDNIARKLGIQTDNARQKFRRCFKRLQELIRQKELLSN